MSLRTRDILTDRETVTARHERLRLSHQEGVFVDDFNHRAIVSRQELWTMNCAECGEKYESPRVPRCLINKLKCPKCIARNTR